MRNITKNYLKWNYLAVIVLTVFMIIMLLALWSDPHCMKDSCIIVMMWSIIWICIVPMFVGNLAKLKRLKPKFWFACSIIATLLPLITLVICIAVQPDKNIVEYRFWYDKMALLNNIILISALLPPISFLTFWLYGFFNSLDWSSEDVDIAEADAVVYEKKVSFPQNQNICPYCNTPIDADAEFCEICGKKIELLSKE